MSDEPGLTAAAPKGADPRLEPAWGRRFRLTSAILAGGIAAAIVGSRIMLQEIDSQADMPGYALLRPVAAIWQSAMQRVGAASPDRVLHDGIRAAEAAHSSAAP